MFIVIDECEMSRDEFEFKLKDQIEGIHNLIGAIRSHIGDQAYRKADVIAVRANQSEADGQRFYVIKNRFGKTLQGVGRRELHKLQSEYFAHWDAILAKELEFNPPEGDTVS